MFLFVNHKGQVPIYIKRWIYCANLSCSLCGSTQPTTLHILNGCPEALNQGHYTWRHDSVLSCLFSSLVCLAPNGTSIYADLPHRWCSDNPPATVPLQLSVSSARPDMAMRINKRKIHILELTVCSNTPRGFDEARTWKLHKPSYYHLISDLETRGVEVSYTTLEIGSLMGITIKVLQSFSPNLSKASASSILQKLARVSIDCFFNIFNAWNSSSWGTDRPFLPNLVCLFLYWTL